MNDYARGLGDLPRFKQQPQMTPWVGQLYGAPGQKKILFLGESHYLPAGSSIHLDAEGWYEASASDLTSREIVWTNTAAIVASGKNQRYESKAHRIFANLEHVLLEVGFAARSQMLDHAAFYNFFQRPARTGLSIQVAAADIAISRATFLAIDDILKPDLICVVSRLAWSSGFSGALDLRKDAAIDFFPHPGSAWWNKPSQAYRLDGSGPAVSGRAKLSGFLRTHAACDGSDGGPRSDPV